MAVGLKMINGDWVFDAGSVDFVDSGEKCLRDFGKMLVTDTEGSDNITTYYRYNPAYGNMLRRLYNQSGIKRDALLEFANDLVFMTVRNYLDLQEQRDNLSEGEIIVDVSYDTYYDPNNSAVILVPISIQNGTGQIFNAGTFEERVM